MNAIQIAMEGAREADYTLHVALFNAGRGVPPKPLAPQAKAPPKPAEVLAWARSLAAKHAAREQGAAAADRAKARAAARQTASRPAKTE